MIVKECEVKKTDPFKIKRKEIKNMPIVEVFKLLSDKNRLRILNLLYGRELCVCELEYLLGISQSNLSKHLSLMRTAEFLTYRRENKFIYYSINETCLEEHPFLKEVFERELIMDEDLKNELKKFKSYEKSELTCQNISTLI